MQLHQAIEEFLLASGADGLKEKTLIWYGSLLKTFAFAFGDVELETIEPNAIRRYLVGLKGRYSEDTVHGHTRALHKFWRWCAEEYKVSNPMTNIRYPKQLKPKLPKAVTAADVIKLLEACDGNVFPKRDRAIVAFLADTGCRAAGLCSLRVQDVDLERGRAYVVEKGAKRRAVMFSDFTKHLLQEWLTERASDSEYVFQSRAGEQLTPNGLLQLMYRLKAKAGITGRANPHAFRHGFAREYLMSGGDLSTLSRLMGHEDVSVTASFYGVFAEDELAQAHRAHSNLLRIKMSSNGGHLDPK